MTEAALCPVHGEWDAGVWPLLCPCCVAESESDIRSGTTRRLSVKRDPARPTLLWDDPAEFVRSMDQDEKGSWLRAAINQGAVGSKLAEIALLIVDEAGL